MEYQDVEMEMMPMRPFYLPGVPSSPVPPPPALGPGRRPPLPMSLALMPVDCPDVVDPEWPSETSGFFRRGRGGNPLAPLMPPNSMVICRPSSLLTKMPKKIINRGGITPTAEKRRFDPKGHVPDEEWNGEPVPKLMAMDEAVDNVLSDGYLVGTEVQQDSQWVEPERNNNERDEGFADGDPWLHGLVTPVVMTPGGTIKKVARRRTTPSGTPTTPNPMFPFGGRNTNSGTPTTPTPMFPFLGLNSTSGTPTTPTPMFPFGGGFADYGNNHFPGPSPFSRT